MHSSCRSFLGLLTVLVAAPAWAQDLSAETKKKVLEGVERILMDKAFVPGVALTTWPTHIGKRQEAIDAAKRPDDLVRVVNAALREFGISHIRMLTPTAEKRRVTRQRTDLGIRVRAGQKSLVVVEVVPQSAAESSGIASGDQIMAVDGKPTDRPDDLEGGSGTQVLLSVKKSDGRVLTVELERRVVSLDRADTLTWLDEKTAVLRIHTFTGGYKREVVDRLCNEAAKASTLLLDLRGNGGGATNNLRHLLGHFLPANTLIGTFVSRGMAREFAAKNPDAVPDPIAIANSTDKKFRTDVRSKPTITARVAVLVNRGTGSASEITSAALREVLAAPLVGGRTAGAVLASSYAKLEGGFGLQYPLSDYVTAKGVRLEKQPLVPDLTIEAPTSRPSSRPGSATSQPTTLPYREDPVVKAALRLLAAPAPAAASRPSSATGGR